MLIPLEGEQAKKSPFPPGAHVDVYRNKTKLGDNHHHSIVFCSGTVTESLLEVKGADSCQIIHKVKIQCYKNEKVEQCEKIFKGSQLRLSAGCSVRVNVNKEGHKFKDSGGTFDGVILGTYDVPESLEQYSTNKFWYSVYLLSQDVIKHDILPNEVTYCSRKKKQSKEKDNYSTTSATPDMDTKPLKEQECEHIGDDNRLYNGEDLTVTYEAEVKEEEAIQMEQMIEDQVKYEIEYGTNESCTGKIVSVKCEEGGEERETNKDENQEENKNAFFHPIKDFGRVPKVPDCPASASVKQIKQDEPNPSSDSFTQNEIHPKKGGYDVFIANIPSGSMSHQDIASFLEPYGKVQRVSLFRSSAKVYFEGQDSCEKCMRYLHNQLIFDSCAFPVRVSLSRSVKDVEYRLYVRGLPTDVDPATLIPALMTRFKQFGEIRRIYSVKKKSGHNHDSAMIIFTTAQSVSIAYNAFQGNRGFLPGFNIPIQVEIPDLKTHKRQLSECKIDSKRQPTKADSVAFNAGSEITEPNGSMRSPVASKRVSSLKRERQRNDSSMPQEKKSRQLSHGETRSPCNNQAPLHVARIYVPLPRPRATGCIVGPKGATVQNLMRYTRCKIIAIQFENIPHCVEVISQSRPRAEAGAHHVMNFISNAFPEHFSNSRECYYDWSNESVVDAVTHQGPTSPPTMRHRPNVSAPNNVTSDSNWRISFPYLSEQLRGFIIGVRGSNHKALLKELKCKMIKFNYNEQTNSSSVEVFDRDDSTAKQAAEKILGKVRLEFGRLADGGRIEKMS
mmetsp:Transcript_15786/g.23717  ORF Transcript_15786/g.23717 Transcript_15786/m.23717 type:complete len:785 (-) Transcript_15786:1023-3377(-)|eukprot:CAMPEP_0203670068 /NCGR_PEP_ID=MMETSP0090-20130426/6256_1 /ASSEMBLY_ACC=CAM_ASM_001088 /TAXON_ID=426623 /ORGANISM="Chaetoceros affinis, Strain CCMP159" /LENGTH=784 /DNA_ID=CAMNT_0050534857 /DNA_START=144 /DNA_END=2498 /DNA_ORIENTATION=-